MSHVLLCRYFVIVGLLRARYHINLGLALDAVSLHFLEVASLEGFTIPGDPGFGRLARANQQRELL